MREEYDKSNNSFSDVDLKTHDSSLWIKDFIWMVKHESLITNLWMNRMQLRDP